MALLCVYYSGSALVICFQKHQTLPYKSFMHFLNTHLVLGTKFMLSCSLEANMMGKYLATSITMQCVESYEREARGGDPGM